MGNLVSCPHCGAEYDAARNLSARHTSRLERGPVRLTCGACGGVFTASPDPAGAARMAAARRARTAACVAGAVVAVLVVAVLSFPRRGSRGRDGPAPLPARPGDGSGGEPRREGEPAADPKGSEAPGTPDASADPVLAWAREAEALTRALPVEFQSGFAYRAKHPYLIALEKDPRFAVDVLLDSYAEQLERLHATLQKDFPGTFDLRSSGRVLPVVVLGSREAYDRYVVRAQGQAMPESVGGHYEYARRRLILYPGPRGDTQVLFHEGTHQIVHHFAQDGRGPEAFWFLEGLACYYEAFARDETGGIVFHVVNRYRLPAAAEAVEAGGPTPLGTFLRLTVDDFWRQMKGPSLDPEAQTRRAQRLYAEAWALWHVLLSTTPDRKRAAADYVRAELKGIGGVDVFEAVFGDLEALQRELRDHVLRLKAEEERER